MSEVQPQNDGQTGTQQQQVEGNSAASAIEELLRKEQTELIQHIRTIQESQT